MLGQVTFWKLNEVGRKLVKMSSAFKMEHMINFPVRVGFFLLPEGLCWDLSVIVALKGLLK